MGLTCLLCKAKKKISNKVVIVACRRLKSDEYLAIERNWGGKMVEFNNFNVDVKHEIAPIFIKFDTMKSPINYPCRLDGNKYSE